MIEVGIPILVLAGAAGFLFFSLLLRKQTLLTASSAATCLFYIGFIVGRLLFYATPSVQWNTFWLEFNIAMIPLTALSLVFFVKAIFLHNYQGRDLPVFITVYSLFAVFFLVELFVTIQDRSTYIQSSTLFDFQFRDSHPGPVDSALYFFLFLTFAYLGLRLIVLLKRKQIQLQAMPLLLLACYFIFVSFDILVALKVIPFMFYVAEPGFFFLILIISYVNSDVQKFAASHPNSENILSDYRKSRYKLNLLDGIDAQSIAEQLNELMVDDKLYLDSELTLQSTAKELSVAYTVLSQVVNVKLKSDFRNYVNKFRIDEAKRILAEDKERSVLEICYQVGFQSKSAFNNAFKKFTDQSPTQYRDKTMQKRPTES